MTSKHLEPLTLQSLPDDCKEIILKSYLLKNRDDYRSSRDMSIGLFADSVEKTEPVIEETGIIWATDNYDREDKSVPAHKFNDFIPNDTKTLALIIPRSQKAKAIQKKRTKEKAEVFTPSWVCNLQNNLIDSSIKEDLFNVMSVDKKTWTPTKSPVKFPKAYKGDWLQYIHERRLEITAGEAPYLVSPADTTTGLRYDVRDEAGRYQRIGLLDRKLRICAERTSDKEVWKSLAYGAFRATYGYEFQGDNLLLARLNLLNTYRDYYFDKFNEDIIETDPESFLQIARVVSWNLWQMDGLKAVVPNSCRKDCRACEKKNGFHDGQVSVIEWNDKEYIPFENFMKDFLIK